MTLNQRRMINISLTVIVAGLFLTYCHVLSLQLKNVGLLTGWIIFSLVIFLYALNIVRRMTFYSWARAQIWSQLHIYIGLFSLVVIFEHAGYAVFDSWLEILLTSFFVITALSGIFGLYIYRTYPQRLTQRGNEVIYARIPTARVDIMNRAEEIILQATKESESTLVADFYNNKLQVFFEDMRNFWPHIFESRRVRHQLLLQLRDLRRYVSAKEQDYIKLLSRLVQEKDNLDYHYSLQSILKYWLFVHIPVAAGMIIFMLVHMISTLTFR